MNDADDAESSTSLERIAPDAIPIDDAADMEHKFRLLCWGPPGAGKTHMAYTMPQPICMIDTERKGESIANKFDGDIYLWQPTDYDGAKDALDQSIDVLDHYRKEENRVGTIVVDSISEMWDMSQQKHVQEHYPGRTVDEVEFSSAFGQGQGDWKIIKRYHNVMFRDTILDTPYHTYWTAMETDDYGTKIDEGLDYTPQKAAGERTNVYRASDEIRLVEGDDGAPIGMLIKSALTKYRYAGLRYPTFEKHKDLVTAICEAEESGEQPHEMSLPYEVTVSEGRPRYNNNNE